MFSYGVLTVLRLWRLYDYRWLVVGGGGGGVERERGITPLFGDRPLSSENSLWGDGLICVGGWVDGWVEGGVLE